jgi:hypothetical protein
MLVVSIRRDREYDPSVTLGEPAAWLPNPSSSIKLWALRGVASIAVMVVGCSRWITSSGLDPSDSGSDLFNGLDLVKLGECGDGQCVRGAIPDLQLAEPALDLRAQAHSRLLHGDRSGLL